MERIAGESVSAVKSSQVNTTLDNAASARMFFEQVAEFCEMAQDAFLARFDTMSDVPVSGGAAAAFAETLLLCPTTDAARSCIRKDLIGALSFVMAVQGVQQRIQQSNSQFPSDSPEYQTKFYLLASAVRDYMDSLRLEAA
jgi:hypothetical protein